MNLDALESKLRVMQEMRSRTRGLRCACAQFSRMSEHDAGCEWFDWDMHYHTARKELSEALFDNASELIGEARECVRLRALLKEADAKLEHIEACVAEVLGGLEE